MPRKNREDRNVYERDRRRDLRHPGWKNPFALFIPVISHSVAAAYSLDDPVVARALNHGLHPPDPATAA